MGKPSTRLRAAMLVAVASGSLWLTQCEPQFVAAPDREDASSSSSSSTSGSASSSGAAADGGGSSSASSSSSSGTSPEASPLGEEEEAWLAAHNEVRANAQPTPDPPLDPLTWDPSRDADVRGWTSACDYSAALSGTRFKGWADTGASIPTIIEQLASARGNYTYSNHSCAGGFDNCNTYLIFVQRELKRIACARHECEAGVGTPPPQKSGQSWEAWACTYAPARNPELARPY